MSRINTLGGKTTTAKPARKTKTVTKKGPTPKGRVIGGATPADKWRCAKCTFLSEGETCSTCGAPKAVKPANIPDRKHYHMRAVNVNSTEEKKQPQKPIGHYDPRDNSENVPIAGIKKHHYEPGRVPRHPDVPAEPKKPQMTGPKSNIATLSSVREDENQPHNPPKMPGGRRDLLGQLQKAQDSLSVEDALPCMRKPKPNPKKK